MRKVTTTTSKNACGSRNRSESGQRRFGTKAGLLFLACLNFCLGAVIGCSDASLAHVRGKLLTKKGEPLVGATVTARSKITGVAVKGSTDQEGRFELASAGFTAGIPPGEYEVIVVEYRAPIGALQSLSVAPRYLNASTSGLTLNVAPGEDQEVSWTLDPP
jgi:hypothetical protein